MENLQHNHFNETPAYLSHLQCTDTIPKYDSSFIQHKSLQAQSSIQNSIVDDPFHNSCKTSRDSSLTKSPKAITYECSLRMKNLLKDFGDKVVFISTRTTGVIPNLQIIELGITNLAGDVLYKSFFKPSVETADSDFKTHMTRKELLNKAPLWSERFAIVARLLKGKKVISFNARNNFNALTSTCNNFDIHADWVDYLDGWCAMRIAANAYNMKLHNGPISLETVSVKAQLPLRHETSATINDCLSIRDLIVTIAQLDSNNLSFDENTLQ